MENKVFEAFNNGTLKLPAETIEFASIPWCKAAFEGVELKHIVTSKETDNAFS